jgi:hypothetical protein
LNILGESSVDKMLKGKHYNNAMRVLKYLYDTIKRHSIESYEQWLKESSDTTDHDYLEFIESTELQIFVRSPGEDTLETIYETHSEEIHKIQDFELSLLNGRFGPTASLWASFLQMFQTLFDFMRLCFSTSEGTVQRWSLTSHVAAKSQSQLEEFLGMTDHKCVTKDLAQKRISFDEECTSRSYELLKDWGTPFKENSRLVHLCSGLECSDDVQRDLMNAEKKGKDAMINFIDKRIESREEDMFAPIPKMKLKTFSSMKAKKSCRVEERNITMKADRDIFARLLVICGKREVSLRDVLTYSLEPIPWSLADVVWPRQIKQSC